MVEVALLLTLSCQRGPHERKSDDHSVHATTHPSCVTHTLGVSQYGQFQTGMKQLEFEFVINSNLTAVSLCGLRRDEQGALSLEESFRDSDQGRDGLLLSLILSIPLCVPFPLIPPPFLPLRLNSPVFSKATARCLPVLPDSSQRDG